MTTRPMPTAGAKSSAAAESSASRTIAEFEIKHHQLLNPAGQPNGPLPEFARRPDALLEMYRMMTLVRAMDAKAVNLQRTGKLGTYASCLGHEAAHVGAAAAMRPEDVLVPYYREYGAQLWRGVQMSEVLRYWGGDESASNFKQARKDFPWCVPIATQMLHAAGVAMAMKVRQEKRCAVGFIGDGGTSEGAFYEALNLAGARSLPVVFIAVNNQWAISVPIQEQTACATLAQKAIGAGMPGVQVDGNDVIAMRQAVSQALGIARNGGGPTLIEALTYRLSDHTTADDASRYRPKSQVEGAWKLEPLLRLRQYLTGTGAWSAEQEEELKASCAREVEAAVTEYLNAPRETVTDMFDHLFANPPRHLQLQRQSALRYAGKGGH